jgi:hypothetical protein
MSGVEEAPRPAAHPRTYQGITVPYITAWSSEDVLADPGTAPVLRTGPGRSPALVYPDEQSQDRDRYGILWRRVTWAPGEGRPRFARVHPTRHRRVMLRGSCQICTAPASLWMTAAPAWQAHLERLGPDAPYMTVDPPVCRLCAVTAAAQCPRLGADGFVFLAPRRWANIAVRGQVADPSTDSFSEPRLVPLPGAVTSGARASVDLRLVMAETLVSGLFEITVHHDADAVDGLGERLDPPSRPRTHR